MEGLIQGGMRYRQLGDSDLHVSEISLGSWLTYGGGVANDQAEACVAAAFEAGINFIDTANVYAVGAAEEFLGEVLAARPRNTYVLATKLFFPMDDENYGLSREQVFKQIDASLARLRTDYVDLYQCHRYDDDTPLEETLAALTEVVRAGKARYLGFSEWTADQIQAALDLSAAHGYEKFVSSQPQYSMLWRVPEAEVMPLCAANGISQIVWSPLAQGALTGKYKPGRAAAGGIARNVGPDGQDDGPLARRRRARGRPTRRPDCRAARHHDGPARARVGAARAERRIRDRRRVPSRAGARERGRLGDRARRCDLAEIDAALGNVVTR